MRFDSFRSVTRLLEALGSQGYQVPFLDYEQQFKNKGFNKHIHCYNFKLMFYDYDGIYSNQMYFILSTQDNDKVFSITGSMTKFSIEEQLRKLLLAYVKFEIPFDVGTQANELLKLLGTSSKYFKGGSHYGIEE